MTVYAEFVHYQSIKMACQKIGQVKNARFPFMPFQKGMGSPKEFVTMCSGQPFQLFFCQNLIQLAASATIRVSDKNCLELTPTLVHLFTHRWGNQSWLIMQACGQALNLQMIPTVESQQRRDFMRQCATGDNQAFLQCWDFGNNLVLMGPKIA